MKYFIAIILIMITFIGCSGEPDPIDYGKDECEFCRMLITDNKYGAELVTEKGKIYKFDSIECLVEFSLLKNTLGDTNNKLLVTDFYNPGKLINCRESFYVKNDSFRSPMGLNVTAFADNSMMMKFAAENGGEQAELGRGYRTCKTTK